MTTEKSFAQTSDSFSIITTLKKAEDDNDVVLIIMEAEGIDKKIKISLNNEVDMISRTNMIEDNPKYLNQQGKILELQLGKFAVETYKFK